MRIDGTAFTHLEVGSLGSNGFGGTKKGLLAVRFGG